MSRSPLSELFDAEQQVIALGGDLARQVEAQEEILYRTERQGRVGKCFVQVYRELAVLRSLRAERIPVAHHSRLVRELHEALHGIPGVPPEPAESFSDPDKEIAHLDAVLHALDTALALKNEKSQPAPVNGEDGEMTLAEFASLSDIKKSTLEKRRPKPPVLAQSTGRKPALYSYRALCDWLPTVNLRPKLPLPLTFAQARDVLAKMLRNANAESPAKLST